MTTPQDSAARLLGQKTFDTRDQTLFAKASGDYNPMHMDEIASRRLLAGRQVVHGIHVFFAALESFLEGEVGASCARLNCTFSNPVCVGDTVCFVQREVHAGTHLLQAVVNGLICVHITVTTSGAGSQFVEHPGSSADQTGTLPISLPPLEQPLNEDPSVHVNKVYRVDLMGRELEIEFPKCCRFLGIRAAAGIASLSYFIGMVCPGLHSVFASFSCRLLPRETGARVLDFSVRKYDSRYRHVDVAFHGPIEGQMSAFLRPLPQTQESVEDLARLVEPNEFAGTRSLVVGGSRGLGELTAKLLAAGGGKVEITYASGMEDARRVQEEVSASGKGECTITKLDLVSDNFNTCEFAPDAPNLVFYYATPHIFRKKAKHFDEGVFKDFCHFYVNRFFDLCSYLESLPQDKKIVVLLPSTVAITDRPRGIAEYAMAKAAAEILAEEINRNFRNVRVLSTRLPRLNTDQTATIVGAPAESNVQILLPLIRSMLDTNGPTTTKS